MVMLHSKKLELTPPKQKLDSEEIHNLKRLVQLINYKINNIDGEYDDVESEMIILFDRWIATPYVNKDKINFEDYITKHSPKQPDPPNSRIIKEGELPSPPETRTIRR